MRCLCVFVLLCLLVTGVVADAEDDTESSSSSSSSTSSPIGRAKREGSGSRRRPSLFRNESTPTPATGTEEPATTESSTAASSSSSEAAGTTTAADSTDDGVADATEATTAAPKKPLSAAKSASRRTLTHDRPAPLPADAEALLKIAAAVETAPVKVEEEVAHAEEEAHAHDAEEVATKKNTTSSSSSSVGSALGRHVEAMARRAIVRVLCYLDTAGGLLDREDAALLQRIKRDVQLHVAKSTAPAYANFSAIDGEVAATCNMTRPDAADPDVTLSGNYTVALPLLETAGRLLRTVATYAEHRQDAHHIGHLRAVLQADRLMS